MSAFIIVILAIIIFVAGFYKFVKKHSRDTQFILTVIMASSASLMYLTFQIMLGFGLYEMYLALLDTIVINVAAIMLAYGISKVQSNYKE